MTQRYYCQDEVGNDFNPHEREARDRDVQIKLSIKKILIHTSVKLVTKINARTRIQVGILIHTSVKLVTHLRRRNAL